MQKDGPFKNAEGRVPPFDSEAERAILGSVILDNACWGKIYALVEPSDFYSDANRVVFNGMSKLIEAGIPVDHITLGNRLRETGDLQKAGGALRLSQLTDDIATTASVGYYAEIVREMSAVRKIIYCASEVTARGFAYDTKEGMSASLEELAKAARRLTRKKMPDTVFSYGDKVMENYRMVAGGYRGISIPWPSLDNMTAGLWPKTVTIFVARPGIGKTFVAVICARHAWMSGKKVLVISPEMDKLSIAERFFVVHSSVDYQNVVEGRLPTPSEERLQSTIENMRMKDGLYVVDSDDDLSPKGLEATIQACHPDLVACDSMYDLKIAGDRKDRILVALEWLKNNSKEYGYAAVGFAQQNRVAEQSEKKGGGSRLSTIALADEIGQDAQTVIALEQSKDDRDDRVLKFRPIKVRRGQFRKAVIRANWDFSKMHFDEILDSDDAKGEGSGYNDIPF